MTDTQHDERGDIITAARLVKIGIEPVPANIYTNDALTVTFCDQGENHVGNQKVGQLTETGFTYQELQQINDRLQGYGVTSYLINLGTYLPPQYGAYNAGVLVIKHGLKIFMDSPDMLWNELRALVYDKHALMYGSVKQKHARHNLCFCPFDQGANYNAGEGTVVGFNHLPILSHVRQYLPTLLNAKATNLVGEANHYYDIGKCGIGAHGDAERKLVIGIRMGKSFPLCYYWYLNSQRVSQRVDFNLEHGDIYIMDEKAVGFDCKMRKIPTLRHAAGCEKYIK